MIYDRVMAEHEHTSGIEALADEQRTFPPSEQFKASALVAGTELYDEAAQNDEAFWARQASGAAPKPLPIMSLFLMVWPAA